MKKEKTPVQMLEDELRFSALESAGATLEARSFRLPPKMSAALRAEVDRLKTRGIKTTESEIVRAALKVAGLGG